jgi:predicted PhzF superfamily epimerase YddE/YHI9
VATLTSPPATLQPLDPDLVYDILDALDWDESDLDTRFTPAVGFVGNAHPILVLDSRETLASMDYDYDVLKELMQNTGGPLFNWCIQMKAIHMVADGTLAIRDPEWESMKTLQQDLPQLP